MLIRRVHIENYRNLRSVDVTLKSLVALVGENNSGKSNFLTALTLPLSSDLGGGSKRLSWFDINVGAKNDYYAFIKENSAEFISGTMDIERFRLHVPEVSVTIDVDAGPQEQYDVRHLRVKDASGGVCARIRFRWFVEDLNGLCDRVGELLGCGASIEDSKMSLLPMDLYRYEIDVPGKGVRSKVPYEVLSRYKYITLPAERDSFASSTDRLGSRALVDILQSNLDFTAQMGIEQQYGLFFQAVKEMAKLDEVLNWQDYSDVPNAQEFFDRISVLPNMPSMDSILGSIRMGYGDESLAFQGLGNRNLILMMVLLNSYLQRPHDISLRLVEVEEPEAHLCVNNVLLMASFFRVFASKNSYTQLVYATHSTELVNKVGLDKVVVLHGGHAIGLESELRSSELDYLAKNPNTDIFTLFFSRKLILVEGLTEELLIKSYLQTKTELNDIKVLSFHKGFKDVIRIWKKINEGSNNKLGIIRDFDDQPNAQSAHESLQNSQVRVCTTTGYTLETEIVSAGGNYQLLHDRYGADYGWTGMSPTALDEDWRKKKSDVMLRICQDLVAGEIPSFSMPKYIQEVLNFVQGSNTPASDGSKAADGD